MAPTFASTWRSFWHTMTSYDRHASHDSPYRTGQHVPLNSNRHAPLTSVASGVESTADLNAPYDEPDSSHGFTSSTGNPLSPTAPYSPGMRTSFSRKQSDENKLGEIQMSNFRDGLPPPPPPSHSWKRIDRWADDNYEELSENMCEGCTQNDINELETQLDCSLPMDVRESLMVHDGQERGGNPTGVLFGCMLLDCEEVVQEWNNWRIVNDEYLSKRPEPAYVPQAPSKVFAGSASSANTTPTPRQSNSQWRDDLLARQDSQPTGAVQKIYAHPAWIPLARDWGGNNIAVDLAPGPAGKWGQVILMGRDYDCKYVVARSWAAFLATVADDLSTDKWFIEEESKELKLREFKNAEPNYIDILRWRCDQKYGRKMPPGKKKAGPEGLHINPNVPEARVNGTSSPYSSPVSADAERGRSPHRFPATNVSTPRPHLSSPLAKVNEEAPSQNLAAFEKNHKQTAVTDNLVSIDTPRASTEDSAKGFMSGQSSRRSSGGKENFNANGTAQPNGKTPTRKSEESGGLTTVEI